MLFGGLLWIVFRGTTICLMVTLVRRPSQGGDAASVEPLKIRKRRYARGELSRDEYTRMRRDLAA